ncbi:hypothetical protein QYF36_009484 [Acer negundo]|nr:hypothetical protein QYF36_009484 [Acer negundo]
MSISFELSPVDSFVLSPSGRVGLAIVTNHYGCVGIFIGNFTTYLSNSVGEILNFKHSRDKRVKSPRVIPWKTMVKMYLMSKGCKFPRTLLIYMVCEWKKLLTAHQLIDMVISRTDSQSIVFVIHGMGTGVVKERACIAVGHTLLRLAVMVDAIRESLDYAEQNHAGVIWGVEIEKPCSSRSICQYIEVCEI